MTEPTFVIVDTETTGLHDHAYPLEIAAIIYRPHATPGQTLQTVSFVPFHTEADITDADPQALAVNRYFDRNLWARRQTRDQDAATRAWLHRELTGATLVGANPTFDARILNNYFAHARDADHHEREAFPPSPWHFRLYDVQAATAGAFTLDTPPSLRDCARLWAVPFERTHAHTALGDTTVTFEIFRKLIGTTTPDTCRSITR